jgi:hypothetical protein
MKYLFLLVIFYSNFIHAESARDYYNFGEKLWKILLESQRPLASYTAKPVGPTVAAQSVAAMLASPYDFIGGPFVESTETPRWDKF